jgi:beta-barrel assembly-enhancing protease
MSQTFSRLRSLSGVLALSGTLATTACAPAVTTQQEVQLGAQAAADINRQLPLVQDATLNNYINQLGNTIARQADPRGIQYRFYIVNSNVVNAFAVPGGHIYLNRGLIDRTENLSELAGVLGHEIAHVVERHGIEQMQRAQNTSLGLNLAYILLGRNPGQVEQAAVGAAAQGLVIAPHSRAAERDADERAIEYMTRVGIDPMGVSTFFGKLLQEQQRQPSAVQQWFSTHPLTTDRLAYTQQLVAQIPQAQRAQMTTTTQEYRNFVTRLRQLPAPPR